MSPNPSLASLLPAEMDGRSFSSGASSLDGVTPPLSARPTQGTPLPSVTEMPSPRGSKELSAGTPRAGMGRPAMGAQNTVRAVTPEPADVTLDMSDRTQIQGPRGFGNLSPQTSPRSIPSAGAVGAPPGSAPVRRQGLVFNESFGMSFDSASSSPPPRQPSFRPRTRTMDGTFRQQYAPAPEMRHRVGSFSSAGSLPVDDLRLPSLQPPPLESYRTSDLQLSSSSKDRKASSTRSRLTKRPTSRPTSPLLSPSPSVDSLPLPIPTTDANKILLLMKNLCGKMRGEAEYQRESGGPWTSGICYIEDEKGVLMFDTGENGPFHTPILPDLRSCRVTPVDKAEKGHSCLEINSPHLKLTVYLRPTRTEEIDLWLAALLCWQQVRPAGGKHIVSRPGYGPVAPGRAEVRRRVSSPGLRDAAIIKVAKVQLWDKGTATSPRAITRRPSARDLRLAHTSWKRVSCILQGNGQFKLMTEDDVTLLSVIELPQLARSAIQQLDKSVLDEDYCIAIFPTYSSRATHLSILKPVYISLESRVLFEVWFVLLRAFTVPDIYGLGASSGSPLYEVTDFATEPTGEVFRLEKTITVRVTEAKIRSPTMEVGIPERHGRGTDHGHICGNYLAEVILDGEVRARTTTKMDTKNPFWREDCEFSDLPSSLPYLSVLLKRVDGNHESFTHQLQATLGIPRTGNTTEVLCGSVDISLHQLERGKDHEQWLQILDDRHLSVGTMLVRVRHEELVVLLTRHYEPVAELLHRFSIGLTTQISAAIPGNLRRLGELFLNIFQVSGKATEWLMNMVEDEIDGIGNQTPIGKPRFSNRLRSNESIESSSDREQIVRDMGKSLQGEANLLFRGNSLLTQALEFYMRRLGKEYLKETLAEKIVEISETNPNCEVDPGKLQHGEDLNQHWNRLIDLTTEVWECITASANRLPPELRHVLKYIRAVAEDRYGDFLRTVTYTSVSGFLFLRFICPAILNPKLFGLLRDHPHPRAQRTLTLIAKGLQALANLSTIGKKETWMEPMNKFISTQRQAVRDFLDAVCAIPAERTNISVPASYSTPIAILGRLSPMAREGFPSLPYLIDHPRNFAALIKLWTDVHADPNREPKVYEGDLLEFHKLCLSLQQRSMECFARVESLRAIETASATTEDQSALSDALDRLNLTHQSPTSWATDYDPRPPGSSGSEMEHSSTSFARDPRFGRDARSSRQVSRSSEQSSHSGGGTVRGIRNGMHPRKFLSGFIRKTRTSSPDPGSPAGREKEEHHHHHRLLHHHHDKEKEREKDKEKGREKEREKDKDMGRDKDKKDAGGKGFGTSEP
ncbi:hypothetical protein QBC34DRAFT_120553 [Podospora aff. communis PSN243]|uniref:Ras-GAP domain-containing protein n=1 Tax=Podospora aff. communis PSN243 TaxID=3040156 RepID=A0AAV9GHB5_9PEZI|nr:hypothetical protein QBC34DRAFT_120553 [Podospora aff. communis PSN243]